MDSESPKTCNDRVAKYFQRKDPVYDANVFVVDDEQIMIDSIKHHLEAAGFSKLHGFVDPNEAIDTLRFVRPDVILTDIMMPEISGDFLIKVVRTFDHLKYVPILVVTSDDSMRTESSIIRLGASRVITKPVYPQELVSCVENAIRSSQQAIADHEEKISEAKHNGLKQAKFQEKALRRVGRKSWRKRWNRIS